MADTPGTGGCAEHAAPAIGKTEISKKGWSFSRPMVYNEWRSDKTGVKEGKHDERRAKTTTR
jgi:hypothetical protein